MKKLKQLMMAGPLVIIIATLPGQNLIPAFGGETSNKILEITLPTNISQLVHKFGKPNKIEFPHSDELDPEGQWFRWNLQGGKFELAVLADDYNPTKPNFKAEVRVIELKTKQSGAKKQTIYGFEFNRTSLEDLQKKFGKQLQKSGSYSWNKNSVKYWDNDICNYFLLDTKNRLIGIIQSTSDVDAAG